MTNQKNNDSVTSTFTGYDNCNDCNRNECDCYSEGCDDICISQYAYQLLCDKAATLNLIRKIAKYNYDHLEEKGYDAIDLGQILKVLLDLEAEK